jgi:hypothetical protein
MQLEVTARNAQTGSDLHPSTRHLPELARMLNPAAKGRFVNHFRATGRLRGETTSGTIMRKSPRFSGTAVSIVSMILFTALMPVAHGSPVENLVFTEYSATKLTESLNGVAIGNWTSKYPYQYDNSQPYGNVSGLPGGDAQDAWLAFADPVNKYEFVFLSLFGVMGNTHGIVAADVTLDESFIFSPQGTIYYPKGPLLSTLPYSLTAATVDTPTGAVDVNITFVSGQVPDGAPTCGLLLIAGAALVMARRHLRPA